MSAKLLYIYVFISIFFPLCSQAGFFSKNKCIQTLNNGGKIKLQTFYERLRPRIRRFKGVREGMPGLEVQREVIELFPSQDLINLSSGDIYWKLVGRQGEFIGLTSMFIHEFRKNFYFGNQFRNSERIVIKLKRINQKYAIDDGNFKNVNIEIFPLDTKSNMMFIDFIRENEIAQNYIFSILKRHHENPLDKNLNLRLSINGKGEVYFISPEVPGIMR